VKDGWEVVDGTIQHTNKGGDIITEKQYDNYELKLEWKISEGGNSGIFLGVQENEPKIYFTGIEMQILDNEKHNDSKEPTHLKGHIGLQYHGDVVSFRNLKIREVKK